MAISRITLNYIQIPKLKEGEFLVANIWISMDPLGSTPSLDTLFFVFSYTTCNHSSYTSSLSFCQCSYYYLVGLIQKLKNLALCMCVLINHQHSSSHSHMFDHQMTHMCSSSVLIQASFR